MNQEFKDVIEACIRYAAAEYREAQEEGLDSHACWKCAVAGMVELLDVECNCGYVEPYGFVAEAGCVIHDRKEKSE